MGWKIALVEKIINGIRKPVEKWVNV